MFDEHFTTLDAWQIWNNVVFMDTNFQASCVSANNGLRITTSNEMIDGKYQGGTVESMNSWTYGYFECRCKIPFGAGLWSSFWLYDKDSPRLPEIDVFEYIASERLYMTNHLDGLAKQKGAYVGDVTQDYHKFAAKWTANEVTYYFDDRVLKTISEYTPQQPLHIMLDLAAGGIVGTPGDVFPAYFDVDYVKVWQK